MSHLTERRAFLTAAVVAAVATICPTVTHPQQEATMPNDPLLELLQASLNDKRGVTLALEGSTTALVVTEISDTYVVGRSQQYDRMVVRLDRIQAAFR